jgi:glycerophosphoryl diester phosphodiesterase
VSPRRNPTRVNSWPYPKYVAHRGAGDLAPENTLAAMRVGQAHGCRMVEFDVKLSGDGVPFLLHDDTLDRTTDGHGRADALTWSELAKLDAGSWHSAAFAGEPLPTLSAIARWAIANGVACNIEIKPMPGRERDTGAAVALDAAALWRAAPVPPLAAARVAAPNLARALLVERIPADWVARLSRLACIALDVDCTTTDYRELDTGIIAAAHQSGQKVIAYTANDPHADAQLVAWGVDMIISDAIDVIRP